MRSTSLLVLAVALVGLACGSGNGGGTGTGGSAGGRETGGAGGSSSTGGAGGSTSTGGHAGAGTGTGGQAGGGGTGAVCEVCAVADRSTLCPADVATASMCPSAGATCCDGNDVQWQCGLCAAETCHWIRYCPTTGTGGAGGHGGQGGQGGKAGGGGAGGAAGQGGHGGVGGQAGGPGGNNGGGGQGGNGATCTQLETQYATAFLQARMCNAAQSSLQCTHLVASSLTCGCQGWVKNTSQLDAIAAQWTAAGCTSQVCPVACANPGTSGACAPIDSGDVCMPAN